MRFAILLVFVALTVTAIMAKDLRADTSTAAPVTTPVTEGTGSTSEATEGTGTTAASTQAPATTEGNGASTISSTSVLLLSVAMCLFKF